MRLPTTKEVRLPDGRRLMAVAGKIPNIKSTKWASWKFIDGEMILPGRAYDTAIEADLEGLEWMRSYQ